MALPKRRPPEGLITPANRGAIRLHRPIDNACGELEMEEIEHNRADCFEPELYDRMNWMPLKDLHRHYPELVFERLRDKRKPKGWDLVVGSAPHWCVARFRTAAERQALSP